MLSIFKDLYVQTKHKLSKLVHTAKCKFYTERIALASSSKELHQIVNTLSNRHPPQILPTIYPSADLPSIFIKHFTNKLDKLRANIASEHVTSTLVTGTIAATFYTFEKVSQLTVKECILNSAAKSCELDPIPFKLLIECLDSILPSLTDQFNSSLASWIFPQCFKSALVTPILKNRCLDHNDLNNYRSVSNLCFIAKILEKLVLSQVSYEHIGVVVRMSIMDTDVDGSNPSISMFSPWARDFIRIASVDSAVKWVPGGDNLVKSVQCYKLFGGIALKNHAFSFLPSSTLTIFNQHIVKVTALKQFFWSCWWFVPFS